MNDTTASSIGLDDKGCEVSCQGQRARLTVQEFRVLKALATKPGVTVTRPELELALYGAAEKAAASNVVEVLVARLRRKLKDIGAPNQLQTVRGTGYAFTGQVA